MVGAPKHLHDLNKLEADVRVICRKCGFEMDWTVAELSAHLVSIGGNLTWSEITRNLSCRRQGCGGGQLRATPVPFSRRQANLPRRIGNLDVRIIATAMRILEEAVARSPGQVYARDRDAARLFWKRASTPGRPVSEGLHDPLALIHHALRQRGWLAEVAVEERVPHWPWSSPAPPGWRLDGR